MSALKQLGRWGGLAKIETTYGTFAAPAAATDAILLLERPQIHLDYAHDGARNGNAPGTVGGLPRVNKTGRSATVDLVSELAGVGVPYSASKVPSLHTLLRMAGFDAALSTTPGTEKYTYTPTPEGSYVGGSLELYEGGQKWQLAGGYAEMKMEFEAGAVPKFTFPTKAVSQALPTDAALAAITYADALLQAPAKAEAMLLTLGGVTPTRIKSGALTLERGIEARGLDNSTGNHGGFNPGAERKLTLEVTIEALALATMNPYNLAEIAQTAILSLQFGATQYKRWKVNAPVAQLAADPDQDDNNAKMWHLVYELKPSSFTANDELSIVCD